MVEEEEGAVSSKREDQSSSASCALMPWMFCWCMQWWVGEA